MATTNLSSRFIKIPHLYDTISFTQHHNPLSQFTITGNFDCPRTNNSLYKAYQLLLQHTHSKRLEQFFAYHSVVVDKRIPAMAGLGGGSSDAGAFLRYINQELSLGLSLNELNHLGIQIGSDVPFFIQGFDSANVFGIGDIIEEYDEDIPAITIATPPIKCSTPQIYAAYRAMNQTFCSQREITKRLLSYSTATLLERFVNDPHYLNDLLSPCLQLHTNLSQYLQKGYFLSGSGSSLFYLNKA